MVLEITQNNGFTFAHCPCHRPGAVILLAASHTELEAHTVRGALLELIEHARECPDASSIQAAQVNRLLAERHPRLP